MSNIQRQKKVYIEWLRIMATLLVIYNHTRNWGYELYEVTQENSSEWLSVLMLPVCKIAVPVFMMIAGANLLGKQESLKVLFKKRVLRFAIVIGMFGTIQFLRYVRTGKIALTLNNCIKAIICEPAIEPYWFLYLYLGYLLMLPFLRKLAVVLEKKDYQYLFYLMVLYNVSTAMGWLFKVTVNGNLFTLLSVNVFFYPLMGYGIDKYSDKNTCKKYGVLGMLVLITAIGIGNLYRQLYPQQSASFVTVMQSFTPLLACSAFGLSKMLWNLQSMHVSKLLTVIGGTTFGVYLTEDMIRNQVEKVLMWWKISEYTNDFLVAILYVVVAFTIGVCITYILKKIPGFKALL